MPFLKQQIELVNDALRAGALSDSRFQNGRYEAIAVDVSRINDGDKIETFPAIMNDNYEPVEVVVSDTYPIVIYHKILSKRYQVAQGTNFGDNNKAMVELVEAKMVVYGKYAALRLTTEELEAVIASGFPDVIAKSKLAPYKIDSMNVTLQSSNYNAAQVFQEEYKGFELFLSAEDIFFSVRYSIESRYRKGCFTICDCHGSVTGS